MKQIVIMLKETKEISPEKYDFQRFPKIKNILKIMIIMKIL
jgi:hypothetical protein